MARTISHVLPAALALSVGLACGDGGGSDGAADGGDIIVADAAPPDASQPDAFVCGLTECNGACVDTDTDRFNCGGCGEACASPAIDCEQGKCSDCPTGFLPEPFAVAFDFVQQDMGQVFGVGVVAGVDGDSHALLVLADSMTAETGVDIDLSDPEAPAGLLIGYRVDLQNMTAQSNFVVTGGTLVLSDLCDSGITGNLSGATFVEAEFNGAPIPDGCTLSDVSLAFALGECAADM